MHNLQEHAETAQPTQAERDCKRYCDEHGQIGAHLKRNQVDVEEERCEEEAGRKYVGVDEIVASFFVIRSDECWRDEAYYAANCLLQRVDFFNSGFACQWQTMKSQ